jgi:hypothetical protein
VYTDTREHTGRAVGRGLRASGRGKAKAALRGGPKSAAKGIIEAGVLHLASLQQRGPILREDCYNVVRRAPTVGNASVVPDSKREREGHARAMLFWVLACWRWQAPWRSFGGCTYWPAADFGSEARAGVDPLKTSPARQRRARGRIEHTLLDGDVAPTDLGPSPAKRTIPHKSAECFYL